MKFKMSVLHPPLSKVQILLNCVFEMRSIGRNKEKMLKDENYKKKMKEVKYLK